MTARLVAWMGPLLIVSACATQLWAQGNLPSIETSLLAESAQSIADEAKKKGDAKKGALLFHSPSLACANCHANGAGVVADDSVGPHLAKFEDRPSDQELIESILKPSAKIRRGYETIRVLTTEGQVSVGVLISQSDDRVVMRDPSTRRVVTFEGDEIEQAAVSDISVMPAGLVNQLSGRQSFLDLLRYLMEIRDGGPARAQALQPAADLLAVQPLPEYESHVDHAGLIRGLDEEAFERGAAIYSRLCVNCHGTIDEPGSLPTSLRFGSGTFKNGSGPFAMYQTLTHGFGLMTAQRWMVPKQKYDVIHYIREAYLREHNPSQYASISKDYLASLPSGDTFGPEPVELTPWRQMDYGPNLIATYEIGDDGRNFAYKGNAIRLDEGPGGISQGKHRIIYDLDTMRVAAAYSGEGFIDWNGINFNGAHGVHPRIVGEVAFENLTGPGWANPATGDFEDNRLVGRDDRRYGPLPKAWMRYHGMYVDGPGTYLQYSVGDREITERPAVEERVGIVDFQRHFDVAASNQMLKLQVAQFTRMGTSLRYEVSADGRAMILSYEDPKASDESSKERTMIVAVSGGDGAAFEWTVVDDRVVLTIPSSDNVTRFIVHQASITDKPDHPSLKGSTLAQSLVAQSFPSDFVSRNDASSRRWSGLLTTDIEETSTTGPFAIDIIRHPDNNPWYCRMRLTGFDFFQDAQNAAVCDWDGNVWLVRGLGGKKVTWQRIASGLFQPLGLKIVNEVIYVTCRDQICRLHDLDGDGEIDFYENFNNDHQVTEHFHEFAMGLQTDEQGNFYYAKSARHARVAVVPHHGTLLKVSYDGEKTEIVATGFRAANGVCLNDDGTFFVTDQEGHWNPKNRINWVRKGGFYGNMMGYHDVTDSSDEAMDPPLCWITNEFDRSPSELLWVPRGHWGPLSGSLLNFSYGYGKIYVVPHETKGERMQGGMIELPIPQFPTGVMRGRFNASDKHLYAAGMFAWAGNQEQNGGFYRIRYTGEPVHLPVALKAQAQTITLQLSGEIDAASVDVESFDVSSWSLKRTKNYGSEHHDVQELEVASAKVLDDNRTIELTIPKLAPAWCMEIVYSIRTSDGRPLEGKLHHTVHSLE